MLILYVLWTQERVVSRKRIAGCVELSLAYGFGGFDDDSGWTPGFLLFERARGKEFGELFSRESLAEMRTKIKTIGCKIVDT